MSTADTRVALLPWTDYATIQQAAEAWGCHTETVKRLIYAGWIPARKWKGQWQLNQEMVRSVCPRRRTAYSATLIKNRTFLDDPPEGFLPAAGVAHVLGWSLKRVAEAAAGQIIPGVMTRNGHWWIDPRVIGWWQDAGNISLSLAGNGSTLAPHGPDLRGRVKRVLALQKDLLDEMVDIAQSLDDGDAS